MEKIILAPHQFKIYNSINVESGFKKTFRKSNKSVLVFHTANDNNCHIMTLDFLKKYMLAWRVSFSKDTMLVYENGRIIGIACKVNRSENLLVILGKFSDALTLSLELTK
jgi:hypothetical protein